MTVEGFAKAGTLIATDTLDVRGIGTSTFSGGLDVTTTGGLSSNAGLRVAAGESYFDERVGINTISPETTLEVVHETNSSTQGITVTGGNTGGSLHLRGSSPGPSASSDGHTLGNLFFAGYATNGSWVRNAMIGGRVNGTVGSGVVPTDIFFQVLSGGGSSSGYLPTQVRMLINGTGVGIANIRPSTALDVGGVVTIGGSEILIGNYKQATTTIHGEYGKLGIGTTTPFGQVSIESVQGIVGSTTPIFVVGDEGTSTPFLYISGIDGTVGIATTTNLASKSQIGAGLSVATSTYISGGLSVGRSATTTSGGFEAGVADVTYLQVRNLVSCTGDIETDADGILHCGTDETGGAASSADLQDTYDLAASDGQITLTDNKNLVFYANDTAT
ncbi:MAG: hypothetical protein HYS44_00305, partial [Candidatus Niyogibacteria bacterium]|nr:hypothetical protein [Candidatus Niyogibacteria bacterium]